MEVSPGKPILIDKFLESAIEVDVDCSATASATVIGGVMQHIEEAGIHSGDSACVIPPHSLPADVVEEIKPTDAELARELKVKGLMNVQFAVTGLQDRTRGRCGDCRGLRPGSQSARQPDGAVRVQGDRRAAGPAGRRWSWSARRSTSWACTDEVAPTHFSVKESVFPFNKFPGVDIILGPEMRSTGEVMGIDDTFPMAFAKSQMAANSALADVRHDLHLGGRPRQAGGGADRPGAGGAGLSACLDARHGRGAAVGGHRGGGGAEDPGRPAEPDRPHEERRDRPGDQHAERQGDANRRGQDPRGGGGPRRDVHHHAGGGAGRGRGVPGAAADAS